MFVLCVNGFLHGNEREREWEGDHKGWSVGENHLSSPLPFSSTPRLLCRLGGQHSGWEFHCSLCSFGLEKFLELAETWHIGEVGPSWLIVGEDGAEETLHADGPSQCPAWGLVGTLRITITPVITKGFDRILSQCNIQTVTVSAGSSWWDRGTDQDETMFRTCSHVHPTAMLWDVADWLIKNMKQSKTVWETSIFRNHFLPVHVCICKTFCRHIQVPFWG